MSGAQDDHGLEGHGVETSFDLVRKNSFRTSTTNAKRSCAQHVNSLKSWNPHCQAPVSLSDRQAFLPPQRLRASRINPVPANVDVENVSQHRSEYSQRKLLASTPGATANPLLSLGHSRYGLPSDLVSNLEFLGVRSIYPWQSSCLLGKGLLSGDTNLVYTAPTGGGKSLVADILLLKTVIEKPSKKALLVLPYVALVQEKAKWFRRVVEGVSKNLPPSAEPVEHEGAGNPGLRWKSSPKSIRIAGFFGGSRTRWDWTDIDIAICTIEKANALVNCAIEEARIDELGIVALDELHMIDDENRGYILELMVSKILVLQHNVQLVGMSATLSNPELLAAWLGAKYYVSRYRPIPIEEYLVYENSIYLATGAKEVSSVANPQNWEPTTQDAPTPCRQIQVSAHRELEHKVINAVVALAVETAVTDYGVLVFCNSRQGSQNTAVLIAQAMPTHDIVADTLDKRMNIVASLQALPGGFESALAQTILHGVAFHHAGLTSKEREIVGEAYDQGILKVMVATCSLAAGINLPARRVILNGARMGRELVGPAMLRQMRGRAGRKGKDELGESYLCCHRDDLEAVVEILEAEMPAAQSRMATEKRGVKRALLEVITTRLANSRHAVNEYIGKSLLYHTAEHAQIYSMVDAAMRDLLSTSLVQATSFDLFEPTALGQAIVASSLTPEDGIFVYQEMQRALKSFVMDGEMHIFYLFTPIQATTLSDISWSVFREQMEELEDSGMRALRCIGVNPALVNRLVNSGSSLKENTADEISVARTYRRAFAAFQLRDLCNEIPTHVISTRYAVPRGSVQNLAQTCYGFAAGMIKFCQRLGWGMLAAVLEHMVDRLRAGARADLLEMSQVTHVKSRMARVLWENGFKSVRALAEAEADDLVAVMVLTQSRRLRMQGEEQEKLFSALRRKADAMVASANRLMVEAAARRDLDLE